MGLARVSTTGQTLDAHLAELKAVGCKLGRIFILSLNHIEIPGVVERV
jgi:hypothetical protein